MKRRGFLGGAIASLVAKPKVSQEAAAKLAGVNFSGMSRSDMFDGPSGSVGVLSPVDQITRLNALRLLNPWWREAERRRNAKSVYAIHHSIASLQSVSLAGKINMQRERNYHMAEQDEEQYWLIAAAKAAYGDG